MRRTAIGALRARGRLLVLAVAWGCGSSAEAAPDPPPARPAVSAPAPPPRPAPEEEVAAGDLRAAYTDNRKHADSVYGGRRYRVSGLLKGYSTVCDLEATECPGGYSNVTLLLVDPRNVYPGADVVTAITPDDVLASMPFVEARAAKLRVPSAVVISCRIDGPAFRWGGRIEMDTCKLVSSRPLEAERG